MPHPTYVLVAILAVLSAFVYWRFALATRLPRAVKRIFAAFVLAMSALAVIGYGSGDNFDPTWARIPGFIGLTWLAVLFYLTLGGLALGGILSTVRAIAAVRQRNSNATRLRIARQGSIAVAVAAVAAVAFGVVAAATPKVTETTIGLDRLPQQFDGVKIALVADVHAGPTRDARFVEQIVEQVNAQRPDLVLLAGDLIDGTVALVGETLTPLRDLQAPLGVFAVTGNHEYYSEGPGVWESMWSALDVEVLSNSHVELERGGASILLAGITDVTAPVPNTPDLGKALEGRTDEQFTVLMAHQPVHALQASNFEVDLQVSGHTHAGQIWPLRYLVPLQQPSIEGLDRIGSTVLYTTRGAGAWGPPVRVGATPEISMLELTASNIES